MRFTTRKNVFGGQFKMGRNGQSLWNKHQYNFAQHDNLENF